MSQSEQRLAIAGARRLVVKIGSSSLTDEAGSLDRDRIEVLVQAIARRLGAGHQVVLVSSGAIATGFPVLGLDSRPRDLATQQASASVGQGMLVAAYSAAFAQHGVTVGQILLTAEDVHRRSHYRNAQRTFTRLLELGVVPVVNENDTVATDEIRVGDNDRLAALVAHVVGADALILLSDVEGLFDGPPDQPGARLVPEVVYGQDLSSFEIGGVGAAGVGLGGMTSKVQAAQVAAAAGIPVLLTSATHAAAAIATAEVGTVFFPSQSPMPTRMLWLAHATAAHGVLTVDSGAVQALTQRGTSLLPAGITAVAGEFHAGDPVEVHGPDGHVIARGLVNFDSDELPALLGRSTKELATQLGPEYEREVIHRDDLALLTR